MSKRMNWERVQQDRKIQERGREQLKDSISAESQKPPQLTPRGRPLSRKLRGNDVCPRCWATVKKVALINRTHRCCRS